MDNQLSLRISADLARKLTARARTAGVKRSQVVREALEAYLTASNPPNRGIAVSERLSTYIGSISLDRAASQRDELAQRLREHNWRE